ncbi:MAG TPA: MFS transporter [Ilumatobacter sp.]|nr:MFS transporter [Ilumatobacter sp.]
MGNGFDASASPEPSPAVALETAVADVAHHAASPAGGRAESALSDPMFRRLWCGAAVSNAGTWMQSISVPYVIFTMTGSVSWVGLAASAALIPSIVVTPLGGAVADRYPRRTVLLAANAVQALLATALSVTWVAGIRSPALVLTVGAVAGLLSSATNSAWHALISDVVPARLVPSAVSLNSMQVSVGKAVGPAIGGIVLSAFGASLAFGLNAISFGVILTALVGVRPRTSRPARTSGLLAETRAGVALVWSDPTLRRALLLTIAITSLANPLLQLAAPFASEQLDGGAGLVGVLVGAYGGGSVLGAMLLARLVREGRRGRVITSGMTTLGGVVALTGAVARPWVAVIAFGVHGLVYIVTMSPLLATFHLRVAPAMRGRAVSVYLVGFTAFLGIGSFVWSAIADVTGIRAPVVGAGIVLSIVGAWAWFGSDRLEVGPSAPVPDQPVGR